MRTLTVLHRWFGVAFCLLFAMWFASGAVMHWVPFPELTEEERVAGLSDIAANAVNLTPAKALAGFKQDEITRLRLVAASVRAVYIATSADNRLHAIDAANGSTLMVDETLALASARAHAAARGFVNAAPAPVDIADYDQWTVSNGLDAHRPLFRIALNDAAGTELYVSSLTAEVVRDTTRVERIFNYAGSVVHWIYPTALRKNWAAWDAAVWWLSLVATLGAMGGALLGILRLRNFSSPFNGWHYWHHVLGLACATFVLTWITSGWLSMDHGRLFSDGRLNEAERAQLAGPPLNAADLAAIPRSAPALKEVEWFRFAGRAFVRSMDSTGRRNFGFADSAHLAHADIARAAMRLGAACTIGSDNDAYAARSRVAGAIVYRIVCGNAWWQIDGADGRIIEKLDASRRSYRWVFRALHTLDFPLLTENPAARSVIIMLLCAGGFIFSVTGAVIGWRRIKMTAARV